ncbi:MAG: hypothetical protein ACRCZP_02210, partial [Phycicoccus sp.]
VEVFGYIARANDDPRAFSLLAMVVSLFETGLVDTGLGLFVADPGHLKARGMPERLGDALRRGALTTGSNDFLALDWFDLADRPVEVLRRELGIPPKDSRALAAGSRGPWDDGGKCSRISARQPSASQHFGCGADLKLPGAGGKVEVAGRRGRTTADRVTLGPCRYARPTSPASTAASSTCSSSVPASTARSRRRLSPAAGHRSR